MTNLKIVSPEKALALLDTRPPWDQNLFADLAFTVVADGDELRLLRAVEAAVQREHEVRARWLARLPPGACTSPPPAELVTAEHATLAALHEARHPSRPADADGAATTAPNDPAAQTWGVALVKRRGPERLYDVSVVWEGESWRAKFVNIPGNEAVTQHWDATPAVIAVATAACERDVSLRRVIPPAQYAAEKAEAERDAQRDPLVSLIEATSILTNYDGMPWPVLVERLAKTVALLREQTDEHNPTLLAFGDELGAQVLRDLARVFALTVDGPDPDDLLARLCEHVEITGDAEDMAACVRISQAVTDVRRFLRLCASPGTPP